MTRTACCLGVLSLVLAAHAADYTVDAGEVGRPVWSLNGVNAGPGHMTHLPEATFAEQYRQMGIRLVRANDYYGPCDLSQICPWIWNPTGLHQRPHFAETDATIAEIEAAGCDVMFCLGESWYKDDPHNEIPPSFPAVAAACKTIVAHYGGHQATPYKSRIRFWEIWNEPDHSMFWDVDQDPDCEQFIEMYVTVAKALQAEFPWITIGGPGAKGGPQDDQTDLAYRLAKACKDEGAPLDFYSWHYYNGQREGPYVFASRARAIRKALNDAGCGKALNVLNEWNSTSYKPESQGLSEEDRAWNATLGNTEGAAFTASTLIYLHQESDVRYACRYRGDYWEPADGYGLINSDGSLKKPGCALQAYAGLFPEPTDRQMRVLDSSGGDLEHRAIMATTDGGRTVINVLISQYQTGPQDLKLTVRNLPTNWREAKLEHFVVSPAHDFGCRERRDLTIIRRNPVVYSFHVRERTNSSVHLIRLYDATRFPVLQPTHVEPVRPPWKPPPLRVPLPRHKPPLRVPPPGGR